MTAVPGKARRRCSITAAAANMHGYLFVANKSIGLKGKGWAMVWATFHGRSGRIRLMKDDKVTESDQFGMQRPPPSRPAMYSSPLLTAFAGPNHHRRCSTRLSRAVCSISEMRAMPAATVLSWSCQATSNFCCRRLRRMSGRRGSRPSAVLAP